MSNLALMPCARYMKQTLLMSRSVAYMAPTECALLSACSLLRPRWPNCALHPSQLELHDVNGR